MAIIKASVNKGVTVDDSCHVLSWAGLAASGDVGDPQCYAAFSDKTFIVSGTFTGGATVVIEGCNDVTVGDWTTLSNRQGSAMTFSAAGMNTSQDRPAFVRPRLTAGTGGAAILVTAACHRTDLAGTHF